MEEEKAFRLFERGKNLYRRGDLEGALPPYMDALKLFRKIGSTENEAKTLLEVGKVHLKLEDHVGSIEYYEAALKGYRELGDPEGQGWSLKGIALASEKLGDYEASRSSYRKALKMFQDHEMEAWVLTDMARTYELQGAWEDALMDYQRAKTVFKGTGDASGVRETDERIQRIHEKRSRVPSFRAKILVLLVYLAALVSAEFVTAQQSPELGFAMYTCLLLALLLHSSLTREQNFSYLLMSIMTLPLIWMIGLSITIADIKPLFWFPVIAVTILGAFYALMRYQGLGHEHVGFQWGDPKVQILIALSGVLLGTAEYTILKPAPLIPQFTLEWVLIGGSILIISTGLAEELLFRGIIQKNAENVFGNIYGLVYGSLLFTAMHMVWNSIPDIIFVFAVSMFYGYAFQKTRSLVGISFSHGILNMFLFLILPFLLG